MIYYFLSIFNFVVVVLFFSKLNFIGRMTTFSFALWFFCETYHISKNSMFLFSATFFYKAVYYLCCIIVFYIKYNRLWQDSSWIFPLDIYSVLSKMHVQT